MSKKLEDIEEEYINKGIIPERKILNPKELEKIDQEDRIIPEGGVRLNSKKSECCNAPIKYSQGGISIPECSKCGKIYQEIKYKE